MRDAKWIGRSRRVIAAVLVALSILKTLPGFDWIDEALPLLREVSEHALALAAALIALWSALRPDGAKLRAAPALPGTEETQRRQPTALRRARQIARRFPAPMAAVVAAGSVLASGCALTTPIGVLAVGDSSGFVCAGSAQSSVDESGAWQQTCNGDARSAQGGTISPALAAIFDAIFGVARGVAATVLGMPAPLPAPPAAQ